MPLCIFLRQFGIFFCIRAEHFIPFCLCLCTLCRDCRNVRLHLFGNKEFLVGIRPAQVFLCQLDFLLAQRLAVCRSLALLIGCAVADFCFNLDNGGLVGFLRCRNRCLNCVNIIAVRNLLCVPAVSLKALQHILGKCGCCIAFNRNMVAVIQYDNLIQTHCPCQRSRLGGNALL